VGIHLAGEHALELELLDAVAQVRDVGFDFAGGGLVALFGREFDEFSRICETARELVQAADDLFELRALLAEFLRAFRLVPDTRLL
jgi:hypothetical protein